MEAKNQEPADIVTSHKAQVKEEKNVTTSDSLIVAPEQKKEETNEGTRAFQVTSKEVQREEQKANPEASNLGQYEKKSVLFTSDFESVKRKIRESQWQFILVGELHNSNASIKVIEEIAKFWEFNHFFSELLPSGVNVSNGKDLNAAVNKKFKSNERGLYGFHRELCEKGITVVSIEDESTNNTDMSKWIQGHALEKIKERADGVNKLAIRKIQDLLKENKYAKFVVLAGMNHTASCTYKKSIGDKKLHTVNIQGIAELLEKEGLQGLCINVHDPYLCDDKEILSNIHCTGKGYTKFAKDDDIMYTVDYPDILLFYALPYVYGKQDDKFESIFLPGEKHSIKRIKDADERVKVLNAYNQLNSQ